MSKFCKKKKEFNPWPSFVDIFSSVILVLLFFLLFIIVLLAYYLQFITKTSAPDITDSKTERNSVVKTENPEMYIEKIITKIIEKEKKTLINVNKRENTRNGIEKKHSKTNDDNKDTYIGLKIDKSKESKEKNNEVKIKKNRFIITFNDNEFLISNKKYKEVEKGIKKMKDFKKLTITTFLLKNTKKSIILRNKVSLSRSINIMNYIKKSNIDINKVTFVSKNLNNIKEYQKYEENGFILFEITK